MITTSKTNPPKLHNDVLSSFDTASASRNYGIVLGLITSAFLIVINMIYGGNGGDQLSVPLGIRFSKHLLIIPVLYLALRSFARTMPKGHIFKGGLILLCYIAVWTAATIGLANLIFYLATSSSFEQFMNEGADFLSATINSGLLIFETVVFVMIIGFVILQGLKDKGSPED
ncbi:hypothetical protein FUA23_14025 [Neolewinella aurantiaca]|uniref:Uncharacterized protein n=1 Tax=Neolewinella aurantiaca TaxID=2602767 RepID=A0A5C7FD04_9BACT|nr:hypothetical protein [Neolewinella aurantiaca]TXF88581.1 hypothetical protein FUA23_14025 [Neolewinella aurantiaca]